jgi:hypothetical protein
LAIAYARYTPLHYQYGGVMRVEVYRGKVDLLLPLLVPIILKDADVMWDSGYEVQHYIDIALCDEVMCSAESSAVL